ncbi:phenylacetate--CoA ligase family protein [Muricoccus pecuniae]|uniref:Phenylacetate-CoA ligase n=1 Tax=Muricoccus pecuniae TaxID=693023 RepID=A0A840YIU6_9PROT|nr:AMP-binding protein [Roseomonas pecuniae]MBB5694003.1 phenylacetate-CoA ligase [Roseomonas pecuniae]
MSPFYDALETREPAQREAALMSRLPGFLARAAAGSPHAARVLHGVEPAEVDSRGALARLPVTRKSDLIALQSAEPPLGGLNGVPVASLARIFVSPGPIHEPQGQGTDSFRFARALHATGLRAGDVMQNCFSYHFTPAGFMLEGGARALGCPVIPAGTGNTEAQARAMAHLRPRAYSGTPDFLRTILERADELGLDVSSLRLGHVSGGAFLPSLRAFYGDRGLTVLQSYATAECGVIAYESEAREGLILDEEVIVEIVRPGTGDPVAEGEVGEVVVTVFDEAYPLIRFATGDLSAFMPGGSPCGRTNARIRGWMGRADQAAKVRGLFIRPEMVAAIAKGIPGLGRLRLLVSETEGRDRMELRAEAPEVPGLRDRLADALHAITRLRGEVALVPPGSLPNDGKVIDDTRPAPG